MIELTFEPVVLCKTSQPLAASELRTGTAARHAGDGQECPSYQRPRWGGAWNRKVRLGPWLTDKAPAIA